MTRTDPAQTHRPFREYLDARANALREEAMRGPFTLDEAEVVDEDVDDPWAAWVDEGGEG